jgi:D-arabinose 5-phosphate isomerase GutQ
VHRDHEHVAHTRFVGRIGMAAAEQDTGEDPRRVQVARTGAEEGIARRVALRLAHRAQRAVVLHLRAPQPHLGGKLKLLERMRPAR